jgi:Electron transfer flavoprotein domain
MPSAAPMASIVAYTEVRDAAITGSSRFALAEARRIADDLGATVYALLALGPTTSDAIAALAGQVGSAGADRILCCTDEALQGPPLHATHGPLLASVAERLKPTLVLFPEGDAGAELGRPLAERMEAAFLPGSSLEILPGTDAEPAQLVVRGEPDDQGKERVVRLREIERAVVAILRAGNAPPALGEPASDMEMLNYPAR